MFGRKQCAAGRYPGNPPAPRLIDLADMQIMNPGRGKDCQVLRRGPGGHGVARILGQGAGLGALVTSACRPGVAHRDSLDQHGLCLGPINRPVTMIQELLPILLRVTCSR